MRRKDQYAMGAGLGITRLTPYVLIEKAKAYARKNGAKYMEAYPVQRDSPSYRFMGFVKTFEKAGFTFVKMAGTRRHVMTCGL
jgi:hypothetical protein